MSEIAKNRVVGVREVKKALLAGKAGRLYVAKDCDAGLLDDIMALAGNVQTVEVDTRKELGEMAGVMVATAVVAELIGE